MQESPDVRSRASRHASPKTKEATGADRVVEDIGSETNNFLWCKLIVSLFDRSTITYSHLSFFPLKIEKRRER